MATTNSVCKIGTLLAALPQELYDKIYDYTFTAAPQDRIIGHPQRFKPPFVSQVDRSSRKQFSRSYFEGATFTFKTFPFTLAKRHPVTKWLVAQEAASLEDVEKIRVVGRHSLLYSSEDLEQRIRWLRYEIGLHLGLKHKLHTDHPARCLIREMEIVFE